MTQENTNKKIKETLESIEGIKRAEANPYIFTKIMLRYKDKNFLKESHKSEYLYIWKFAAILFAAILLNVFTYFKYPGNSENYSANNIQNNNTQENLKSFSKEYFLTGTTYNY